MNPDGKRRAARFGVVLMGLSLGLWVALLGIPFLPLGGAAQATLAGSLIVIAEIAFWLGAALAGPDAARRMRSWWKRRASEPTASPTSKP